jgi:rSAM/selenodomain-associated transferase 2
MAPAMTQLERVNVMKVSIIVPIFNEEILLGQFLTKLKGLVASSSWADILVVDGGSVDRSVSIAQDAGVNVVTSSRQMNFAAAKVNTEYLLFLHCDTNLPDSFGDAFMLVMMERRPWGFFSVKLSGQQKVFRLIERAITWRSAWTGIGTGDQALFVHRDLWVKVGGYGDLALMEDVDLSKRLRRESFPEILRDCVTTSSRRWQQRGVIKTVVLMWWMRACFAVGVSDRVLARWYR